MSALDRGRIRFWLRWRWGRLKAWLAEVRGA